MSINHQNERYINRMGLYEAIGQQPPSRVFRCNQAGRIVEARAITSVDNVPGLASEISSMFQNCVSQATEDDLSILISELLQNCCAHSVAPDQRPFGLVCGQAWPNGGLAQIAIVDTGVGIEESLSNNEALSERLESSSHCQLACEYGITGKPNSTHSGYGLALAKGLAEQHSGRLIVLSGNELYICGNGQNSSVHLNSAWQGTAIIFEWNVNVALDTGAVYSEWPTPATMEEDEYDEIFD
ncbi:ATP-binding protein [Alteromonas sp. S015]|uniref:ATP-binding protein n=1 Tax=Alteromonas sp. S015 TaxID=3117401 RepID=UPI002FE19DF5